MLITLLTDFGTADYFVGAMKGVILSINAEAVVVDITHEVAPQDVLEGAFTLGAACVSFPPGTIHVAVVDPGVGSARRGILVAGGGQYFVGPDNGLFSFVYERDPSARVFHLTNEKYFGPRVSATFHGRDVFAPAAAALSNGVAPEEFGEEIEDFVRLPGLRPRRAGDGTIEAAVIHVDRFGNCVTNLTPAELDEETLAAGARLAINGRVITSFRRFFSEETDAPGELFATWGSAGYLEIAAYRASAAGLLDAERGQIIKVLSTEC
ncbi:MAG TPA: SAM-dependent chlorinase/fluorinase [Pyrinomonadaceae bacterium]|nr:SAM-dependent chlorinase/fluorinase [Pyrinomonadaceae bacterium]